MSTSNKSFFSFMAGVATTAAASIFFKSENGKKVRQSLATTLKNIGNKSNQGVGIDWLNDLSNSEINNARKYNTRLKF